MKKIIYAVNSGSYSGYGIHAIFSTKADAELFMERFPNSSYNDLEEYELDPQVAAMRKGYSCFRIRMRQDGATENVTKLTHLDEGFYFLFTGKGREELVLMSSVMAKDEQHAVKIVNEQRTQMLATGNWGKEPKETQNGDA